MKKISACQELGGGGTNLRSAEEAEGRGPSLHAAAVVGVCCTSVNTCGNPNVHCGVWVMGVCGYRLHVLVGLLTVACWVCMCGAGSVQDISAYSTQFTVNPKTALNI